ncbi:MAG: phage gp6-like head-tail connector protein [Comamonadaceae bacterium]|nr:MAG: phage gp6-like head-tail connector protein [Comamonadaceae bacterium]
MLTLEETKMHLRVDQDVEDALIQSLIDTATAAVADRLNMEVIDLDTDAPGPVKSAALLLVGDLYANREAQADRPLTANKAFDMLLAPYRVYA